MNNKDKIILDLCGGTGAWSKPYKDAGYDVRLITLPDNDVLTYNPPENVYGILAAPPCTEFAVSGARWWKDKDPNLLIEAKKIVKACLNIINKCIPIFYALENPVGRLRTEIKELGIPKLIFNPCDYGDPYTKKTLLWGNFNLPLYNRIDPEFIIVKGKRMSKIHYYSFGLPKEERSRVRSITPSGFAKCFFEANK